MHWLNSRRQQRDNRRQTALALCLSVGLSISAVMPTMSQPTGLGEFDEMLGAGKYQEVIPVLTEAANKSKLESKDPYQTVALLERIAIAERRMARYKDADAHLKTAMGMIHQKPTNAAQAESKARMLFNLADLLDEMGLSREASFVGKQGVEAVRSLELAGSLPYLETELLNITARIETRQGELEQAGETLAEAAYMADSLPDEPTEVMIPASIMARSKAYLKGKILSTEAMLNQITGKLDKAKTLNARADELLTSAARTEIKDHRYAGLHARFNRAVKNAGDGDPTGPFLAEIDKEFGSDSLVKASALDLVAQYELDKSKLKESRAHLEKALTIREALLPKKSIERLLDQVALAEIDLKEGKLKDAAARAMDGYNGLETSAGPQSPSFGKAAVALANIYMSAGQYRSVGPILTRAWGIQGKVYGAGSPEVLDVLDAMTQLNLRSKDYKKTIQIGAPLTVSMEKLYGAKSPRLVPSLTATGTAYAYLRKHDKARQSLLRAKTILEGAGKKKSTDYGEVLAGLGINDTLQYKWNTASVYLKEAISVYSSLYGEGHPSTLAMKSLYKSMNTKAHSSPVSTHNLLLYKKYKPMAPDQR
ncbi:MAG: tetratricopeptide repeat protein [Candidatus Obscuribacterales bacterium]